MFETNAGIEAEAALHPQNDQQPVSKRRKLGRVCSTCPKPIYDKSTTGQCKPCWLRDSNSDPELRRRRAETLRRLSNKGGPLYHQKCKTLAKARDARDPEGLRERGRRLAENFSSHSEKRRVAHAKAMKNLRHKWLPEEFREQYKAMLRSGGYRAPEAKAIILEHVELQKQRRKREREAVRAARLERQRIWEDARGDLPAERETVEAVVSAVNASRQLLEALKGAAR
jgi:hypothetical protein